GVRLRPVHELPDPERWDWVSRPALHATGNVAIPPGLVGSPIEFFGLLQECCVADLCRDPFGQPDKMEQGALHGFGVAKVASRCPVSRKLALPVPVNERRLDLRGGQVSGHLEYGSSQQSPG